MPEWIVSLVLLIIGLLGLVGGAGYLVRSASTLAGASRIRSMVLGLTLVALGTSAPELAVTVQSLWAGSSGLALGTIVGSNIVNVLLVLGLSALIAPLAVQSHLVRLDVPLAIAVSLLLWLLASRHGIGHLDALLLVLLLLGHLLWSWMEGRREGRGPVIGPPAPAAPRHPWIALGGLLTGLLLVAMGARLLVMSALDLALFLGVDELLIGLTLVAVGTSLPEMVTVLIASLRGNGDLAVGTVLGSNLFNILGALGIGVLMAPGGIEVPRELLTQDLPIMIATALLCLPILLSPRPIGRGAGAVLLVYFVAYLGLLAIRATQPDLAPLFGTVLLVLLIALTLPAIGFSLATRPGERSVD